MSASTPQIASRDFPARDAVSHAETPTYADLTGNPLLAHLLSRAGRGDYDGWQEHIRPAAGCTRPIRLTGQLQTITRGGSGSASIVDTRHTDTMPDGHIYKACGNRRASLCPSCAAVYQSDAYQLLRAGLIGGKGVPETVARHPAVFATLTAPGFGPVHTRHVARHTCHNRRRCDCRADPCHARRNLPQCEHGQPVYCHARHDDTDPRLGVPLCLDCYDHHHQVVWNYTAGELWRRTKQTAERYLAHLARRRNVPRVIVGYTPDGKARTVPPVRIAHGKAAEFQARGAVHFHALLRLDGVDPTDPTAVVAPPAGFTADDLDTAIRHAAKATRFATRSHPDQPQGWIIGWGPQVDVRTITLTGNGEVTDAMVAGYLAKYATKSTEATGHRSTRITQQNIAEYDPHGDHTHRLIHACWHLGRHTDTTSAQHLVPQRRKPLRMRWTCPHCRTGTVLTTCPTCPANRQADLDAAAPKTTSDNPWLGLRRWTHMLGFGGHFLTKARRYSITFGNLRAQRTHYRRAEHTPVLNDAPAIEPAEDTTLIIGTLRFAGIGWHTTADALLANTAAARARERHATGREELAHDIGTLLNRLDRELDPTDNALTTAIPHA